MNHHVWLFTFSPLSPPTVLNEIEDTSFVASIVFFVSERKGRKAESPLSEIFVYEILALSALFWQKIA